MNGLELTQRMLAIADKAKVLPCRILAMFWVQALVLPMLKYREPEAFLDDAEKLVADRVRLHLKFPGKAS